MFSHLNSKSPASKAYVSQGTLPHYVDPEQPSSKKPPFSTISSQSFTQTVQLILPQELYDVVWKDVEAKISNIHYSRVIMSLSEILERDFFNTYIKTGNIFMFSEGRPGVDDRYSLRDGILRLELAKDRYERCGIVGEPIRDAGRKHAKTRYTVEMNLRSPSMLHGKNGFERIVWACKNVLSHSVTWLFHDFDPSSGNAQSIPIAKHHPIPRECSPQRKISQRVRVPNLSPLHSSHSSDSDNGIEDWAFETYEWLSLVALESPRICSGDAIDPFLSRYQVPNDDSGKVCNLLTLTWTGFIHASWIREVFIYLLNAKTSTRPWQQQPFFALSAYSFKTAVADQKDAYTILCLLDGVVNRHGAVAAAGKLKEPEDSNTDQRHGREYFCWELSCG